MPSAASISAWQKLSLYHFSDKPAPWVTPITCHFPGTAWHLSLIHISAMPTQNPDVTYSVKVAEGITGGTLKIVKQAEPSKPTVEPLSLIHIYLN